jgi:hypothetical protein
VLHRNKIVAHDSPKYPASFVPGLKRRLRKPLLDLTLVFNTLVVQFLGTLFSVFRISMTATDSFRIVDLALTSQAHQCMQTGIWPRKTTSAAK